MANPDQPNFLDGADPASYRLAMAAPLEELDRLVEEAVSSASNDSPELRRLVGYCEAMLRRLALADAEPADGTKPTIKMASPLIIDSCWRIASLAITMGELLYEGAGNEKMLPALCVALQSMTAECGARADAVLGALKTTQQRGTPADWLQLPEVAYE